MRVQISVAVTMLALLLAGCVAGPSTQRVKVDDAKVALEAQKQKRLAVQAYMDANDRLNRVAGRIAERGARLCPEQRAKIGVWTMNRYSIKKDFRDAAEEVFGFDDTLRLHLVREGGAAYDAGLREGDILLGINDWRAPAGIDAPKAFSTWVRDNFKADEAASVRVLRGGDELVFSVTPRLSCDYGIHYLHDKMELNAYADGKGIFITRGMMRFAEDDQELALIVAHEIAHNTMDHRGKKTTNYIAGSLLDVVAAAYGVNTHNAFGKAAAASYSQDFEAEADYVGLYLMKLSGYEVEGAANFWRRMAVEHPANIRTSHAATHPATPQRFTEIEKTVEEIGEKVAKGIALEPELKVSAAAVPEESKEGWSGADW